jgi:hypothetical protein
MNLRLKVIFVWLFSTIAACALYGEAIRFAKWEKQHAPPKPQPVITVTRPADGETGVLPNSFVAADVFLPNFGHGVDSESMNTNSVKLFKLQNDKQIEIPGHVNTSGAGDAIVFQPVEMLETGTRYQFSCNGVRDTGGADFKPFTMSFTTASDAMLSTYPVAFEKVELPVTSHPFGNIFTGLTIGPDHRLYAGTYDGRILRYDIAASGALSEPTVIHTLLNGNRSGDNAEGHRLITGLTFDPRSTPDKMILWVTHGVMAIEHCPDWSSKISRLSGPDLSIYENYIVGLPRAWRDHLTFKVAFGPDGSMYFNQGSNSSTGSPDNKWGLRNEHLLNAACLQVDRDAIAKRLAAGKGPLDVQTEDGGKYDPWAPDAPVKLYATGIRCGFSLLWHRNGHLYSALNGGAAGGDTPSTPDSPSQVPRRIDSDIHGPYVGPVVPMLSQVSETQPDLFIDIVKGGYYGHPNITRGEYVLNGGNPDGGKDDYQVHDYPIGTQPDRNWHRPIWNNGTSPSCDGLIEYKGSAFHGALDGKILTTRYSGGKDILLLSPGSDGGITEAVTGIDGFTQFIDPLDLVEDLATGNIYVSEFGGQRLTLLKPKQSSTSGVQVLSRRVFRQTPPTAVSNVQ